MGHVDGSAVSPDDEGSELGAGGLDPASLPPVRAGMAGVYCHGLRFYISAPLVASNGHRIGSLLVADVVPHRCVRSVHMQRWLCMGMVPQLAGRAPRAAQLHAHDRRPAVVHECETMGMERGGLYVRFRATAASAMSLPTIPQHDFTTVKPQYLVTPRAGHVTACASGAVAATHRTMYIRQPHMPELTPRCRVDAGQCRLLNNLAEMAARELEAHCKVPERLASTCKEDEALRRAYATSVGADPEGLLVVRRVPPQHSRVTLGKGEGRRSLQRVKASRQRKVVHHTYTRT